MNTKIKMQFEPEIAKELGVDCAIMYSNIEFWVEHNKANDRNNHDGYYWTYNSMRAFTDLFPFWTEKQIRRILDTLEEKGYIKTGNYNEHQYDRTKWYTCIRPNGQMETPKRSNGLDQMGEPIPDNKPDSINTDNKLTAKAEDEVSKLYHKVIKKYGLPTRNFNNVRSAIDKLKTEISHDQAVSYLTFLLEKYQDINFDFKPELTEALDIHAKRMQIITAVKRTVQNQKKAGVLVI